MAREIVLPPTGEPGSRQAGSLLFIGNATVLLRYAGFVILTDPNFLHAGDRARLGYGLLHARRLSDPALELDELPKLDLVLLSHNHEDHFDRKVARELDHALPIVTTRQAARKLAKKGFSATVPLKTWEDVVFVKGNERLRVTALPGRHGPGFISRLLPSVMGSMLEFETPERQTLLRLYVSGDTLMHRDLRDIPKRFPEVDLGVFHLGGTRVLGVMITMDGKQGAEAVRLINPRTAVPVHYDDYDIFKSKLEEFHREVKAAGLEDRIRYLVRGEALAFQVVEGERLKPLPLRDELHKPSPHPPTT
ncbi:MAG: MBL fold metallo-hydrolase [Myxococcales bacterium]|jgi:L-ascorbate metabolism protein UlaG (beta-lactamase superfamily)